MVRMGRKAVGEGYFFCVQNMGLVKGVACCMKDMGSMHVVFVHGILLPVHEARTPL